MMIWSISSEMSEHLVNYVNFPNQFVKPKTIDLWKNFDYHYTYMIFKWSCMCTYQNKTDVFKYNTCEEDSDFKNQLSMCSIVGVRMLIN